MLTPLSNSFLVNPEYVQYKIMDREECFFFFDLLDIGARSRCSESGWFECSVSDLFQSLLWTEKDQIKLVGSLYGKGYLMQKWKGGKRLINLEVEKAIKDLRTAKEGGVK